MVSVCYHAAIYSYLRAGRQFALPKVQEYGIAGPSAIALS
jgi:hypothetical protein